MEVSYNTCDSQRLTDDFGKFIKPSVYACIEHDPRQASRGPGGDAVRRHRDCSSLSAYRLVDRK